MTNRRRSPLLEWAALHPAIDHALPLALVAAAWLLVPSPLPDSDRTAFLIGVTTAAGLVMTAAVFACALTYQSSNSLMGRVRETYQADLRRNWTSVIGGAFLAAIVPVIALLAPPAAHRGAILVGVYAAGIVTARMSRALAWLTYTLFAQELDDAHPPVKLPALPSGSALRG